jgi:CSLREA domain-containing protein
MAHKSRPVGLWTAVVTAVILLGSGRDAYVAPNGSLIKPENPDCTSCHGGSGPIISLSSDGFSMRILRGTQLGARSFSITNVGNLRLQYRLSNATPAQTWLVINSPNREDGTGEGLTNGQSDTINYTLNTATLPVGSHFARLHIQTPPLAETTPPRSRDFDINITVNDLPVAVNDTVMATQDTPVSGTLAGNDTPSGDGGNVWALATAPANGTVTVNPDGTFTYTPNANFNGTDSFSYTITDADGDVSTATVTVNVAERTDITVNTLSDELLDNGNCSLREAIISANSDSATDACAIGEGAVPSASALPV